MREIALATVAHTYLTQGKHPLLGADAAATDHDKVVVDLSIVREASERGDRLLRDVVVGRGVVLDHLAVLRVNALLGENTPYNQVLQLYNEQVNPQNKSLFFKSNIG